MERADSPTGSAGGSASATAPAVDPAFVRRLPGGRSEVDFIVPDMHCANCLQRIERGLGKLPAVVAARANLTTHRVGVTFIGDAAGADQALAALTRLGYAARPFNAAAFDDQGRDKTGGELLRALAVAGFAAGNIMLLSVSVWSGADAATRDLFHWLSALIALPAAVYAGRPFFRSAIKALLGGGVNMDVPIAIGVSLTLAMSLYETATGGGHAYFDAAITLLFFLLVGRYLDHRMRDIARAAAMRLMSLAASSATRLNADGSVSHVPIAEIERGDRVGVAAGERFPVDGQVIEGLSDVDRAMLTGEPNPEVIAAGSRVFAGTVNLTGPVTVSVTAKAGDTLLADVVRLMEKAERAESRYTRLADRASRLYAPAVHLLALLTAIGWIVVGGGWHLALTNAVAVLIITCPCALGLAVPAVQVVASGALLARGIMLKSGTALERLALVDTAVFDKTGTLTEGEPRLAEAPQLSAAALALAASLGARSRHPLARALARTVGKDVAFTEVANVREHPGEGMSGEAPDGTTVLLGRAGFVGAAEEAGETSEIWLRIGDRPPVRFRFVDAVRSDASEVVEWLEGQDIHTVLLSGDKVGAVASIAREAGFTQWHARQLPAEKVRHLRDIETAGHRALMVGDGLNDAPALASAFVSMSPASAADISQVAADLVFTGDKLAPVARAIGVARAARHLILQNFAIAVAYNFIAVPLAILGFVTPLVAAVAMSSSSIIVTANALRVRQAANDRAERKTALVPTRLRSRIA